MCVRTVFLIRFVQTMSSIKRYLVMLSFVVWGALLATAQGVASTDLDTPFVYAHAKQNSAESYNLRLQDVHIQYENNKAVPNWEYKNNHVAYDILAEVVKELSSDTEVEHTVIIEGAASPIGNDNYNRALALRRAEILRDIISQMDGGNRLKIHAISIGEDWASFAQHIHEKYHMANREEVLAILDSQSSNDDKERNLQALDNGRTWRLLVNKYMDTARNAAVLRIVELKPLASLLQPLQLNLQCVIQPMESVSVSTLPEKSIEDVKESIIEKPSTISAEPIVEDPLRKPIMALRSNLLVPALNIGVEVPIGNYVSIGADYYFPWIWPKRDNKNCFEFLGWGVEARYWFGRNRTVFNRLQGHSLGLYGYMGYYDFEYNFHGYQGEFANIGLDYTYAMAVGKKKGLHLEFSLGIGYIYSQARKYTVIEPGSPLISDKITKKVGFFGPTKANISLVVPIFQKVKPNDKYRGNE